MQAVARRLIIVSAVSLFGATSGVALGNFAAGGQGISGSDELAGYASLLDMGGDESVPEPQDGADLAARSGPSSYECKGCDAALYNDTIAGAPAELPPLPRYEAQDAPAPLPASLPYREIPAATIAASAAPVRPAGVTPQVGVTAGEAPRIIVPPPVQVAPAS